jgi:transposase
MRYVQLTTQQSQQLTQLYKTSPDHRERQRAHALLLSQRSYTIPDLADLFEVDRDTISNWMNRWQDWLLDSQKPLVLQDQARSGRPSTLDTDQKKA